MKDSYIAGLFDGEGCVAIGFQKKKTYMVHISISNNYPFVLYRIQRKYGGGVFKKQNGYVWQARCNVALNFLNHIYPYSDIKRKQIKLAIEFQSKIQNKTTSIVSKEELKYRKEIKEKIHTLNKRHWL